MTTYDDTEAEDRAGPVVRLLYVNAIAWATLGVSAAVVLLGTEGIDRYEAWQRVFQGFLGAVVLLVVTGIVWLRWFKVVAQRTEATGRARLRGPWWFWAWMIPGAYLVLPKMMVNDAWHAADSPGSPQPVPSAIQWWWGLWVATGASTYLLRPLDAISPWLGGLLFGLFFVSEVTQALLAVRVVRELTAKDKLLGPSPAPHPGYVAPSWPATTPS